MAHIGKLNFMSYSSTLGCFVYNGTDPVSVPAMGICHVCAQSGSGWSFFEAALFVVLVAFLLACGIRIFGDYSYVIRSMEISSSGLPPEAMTPLQKEVSNLRAILGGNVLDLKEILGINVLQTDVADLKEGMKELKASVTELRNRIRNRRRELNNNNIIH